MSGHYGLDYTAWTLGFSVDIVALLVLSVWQSQHTALLTPYLLTLEFFHTLALIKLAIDRSLNSFRSLLNRHLNYRASLQTKPFSCTLRASPANVSNLSATHRSFNHLIIFPTPRIASYSLCSYSAPKLDVTHNQETGSSYKKNTLGSTQRASRLTLWWTAAFSSSRLRLTKSVVRSPLGVRMRSIVSFAFSVHSTAYVSRAIRCILLNSEPLLVCHRVFVATNPNNRRQQHGT